MSGLIKILHIDPGYQITYHIYRPRTSISLQSTIALLKKEDFDLIISEPHNKAILKKQPQFVEPKLGSADDQTLMKAGHGDFSEAVFDFIFALENKEAAYDSNNGMQR